MRSRGIAALALVIGGGFGLMSYLPTWATARRSVSGLPSVEAVVAGRALVPAAAGAALLVLAGAVAVWALPGVWVRAVGVLLVLASLLMIIEPLRFIADSRAAVARAVAGQGSVADVGHIVGAVHVSYWWIVAVCCGVIALVGSLLTVFHRGRWAGMSARYERSEAGAPASTSSPDQTTARGEASARGDAPPAAVESGAAAWDALDRGEDPTSAPPSGA